MISNNQFKKGATLRKRILFHRLMMCADRERELTEGRDVFINSYYRTSEEGIRVLESYDKQIEETQAEIRGYLKKAVEIGMGEVELVKLNLPYYVQK